MSMEFPSSTKYCPSNSRASTQIPGLDGNPLGRGRAAPPLELQDESGALRDRMGSLTPGGCLGAKPLKDFWSARWHDQNLDMSRL